MFLANRFWTALSAFSLLSMACLTAQAENWPQWRGPRFNGVSHETNIATEWGPKKNVAWRTPLPGPAGSTPVVFDDQIFLTSADGDDLVLICIGTDGKEQWRRLIGTGNTLARSGEGNSASPSPCTDGKHVWAFIGTGDLACYTVDGELVWKMNLEDRFGEFLMQFGVSTTPVLHDGKLMFQLIHGDMHGPGEPASVVALDAATGKTVWQTPRKTGAIRENKQSYASAILYDFNGLTMLLTHGGDHTIAYDPDSGREIWRFGSFNPQDEPGWEFNPFLRLVASPGVGPGIVVIPTAKKGPVFAVRPDSHGHLSIDGPATIWTLEKATPDVPSPLVYGKYVYLCSEAGIFYCVDAKTGELYYRKRLHGGRYRASPIYADGHVYCTCRDGHVTVIKAGPKLEIIAENDTEQIQTSTPVISNGTLYLRTFEELWAVRKPK